MTQELGTIQRIDIHEVWRNEAEFAAWVADHVPELGAALGLDLKPPTKSPVGGFWRAHGTAVEAQLGSTDDSHLCHLLAHAGNSGKALIWIAGDFRSEHTAALSWLNRRARKTEFFGVVVEATKSEEADPRFEVVHGPNRWHYRQFFQQLVDGLQAQGRPTGGRVWRQHYHALPTGVGGFRYAASFYKKRPTVELYIDCGDKDRNERRFDVLAKSKENVESQIGDAFEWERLDDEDTRACRISTYRQGSIDDDEETLDDIRDWMIDRLRLFDEVFGPRLAELRDV